VFRQGETVANPQVLLVSTGGTISSKFDPAKGYSPALTGADFLADFPALRELADIEIIQPCNVLSFALSPVTVMQIVSAAKEKVMQEGFAGVVVTQGTATLEETSYLADLLWDVDAPLVFTGSMLNSSERDWDGPRNIMNSVMVAISTEARGKGVTICLGGEIHAARDATKIHKTSLAPLASLNTGPLGMVINKRDVVFHRAPLRRKTFHAQTLEMAIDIIKVGIGDDARLLDASIASGARAIVLEAFPGGGGVTPEIMAAVRRARLRDFIFVMAPRSPIGSSLSGAGGGCGPFDLRQCGVITAGDLTATKARIVLMIALPLTGNLDQLRDTFREIAP
jgi:L-asparaginase